MEKQLKTGLNTCLAFVVGGGHPAFVVNSEVVVSVIKAPVGIAALEVEIFETHAVTANQALLVFLAFGASLSTLIAWRYAASQVAVNARMNRWEKFNDT